MSSNRHPSGANGDDPTPASGPPPLEHSLGKWEELTGELEEIEDGTDYLTVEVAGDRVVVDAHSRMAEILREGLAGSTGQRVSILRTDYTDQPLITLVED